MSTTVDARRDWLTQPRTAASTGHLLLAWGLYVALAIAAVRVPLLLRVPLWIAMAWLLLGNGAVVHECTHRHLFRSRYAHRWVGFVAGLTVLLPFGVYRPYHLAHHRHTAGLDDPEGPPLHFRSRWEYLLLQLGGVAFLMRLIAFGLSAAAGRGPSWLRVGRYRRAALVDSVACLLGIALVVIGMVMHPGTVATVWLVPWLLAMTVLVPLVLSTEHYGAAIGSTETRHNTRSVTSNRVVRWLYWNNNLHAAHHHMPTAVHQRLHEVEESLGDDRGDWVAPGYVRFHAQLWQQLPW